MARAREHEEGLALFVAPERRARFRESLGSARRRSKLLDELWHFEDSLDPRFAELQERHVKHDAHVDQVIEALVSAGAPATAYVLATNEHDGLDVPLREAIEALMWVGAGFASANPGRLALYVSEDGSNVYLLRRERP